jgi:hypothetical protein
MLAGCLVLAENRRKGSPPGREHRLRGEDGGDDAGVRERILAQQEAHADDMHDLLVTHECRPILEK